jgi:hypothetical protein
MWYIYSFKLAYAQDNSFDLRVNTNWTCSEFVEKVTAVARIIFPSISVTDVMHITESCNKINDPNYTNMSSEENAPIPRISQTLAERYHTIYFQKLYFYVYFQTECENIQIRHSRNQSRTIEQLDIGIEHYYDIWVAEIDNNRNDRRINTNSQQYILPTGPFERDTSDRSGQGWTGMSSQYAGGISLPSQTISLDDMLMQQDTQSNILDENNCINLRLKKDAKNPEKFMIRTNLKTELNDNNITQYFQKGYAAYVTLSPKLYFNTDYNVYGWFFSILSINFPKSIVATTTLNDTQST